MTDTLDRDWLADHPLPPLDEACDKNSRGRVLIAGGGRFVPGALRLTAEAAFRAGAGKVQMATVAEVALALGLQMPEAAVIALPADAEGELAPDAGAVLGRNLAACDAFVLGPGMSGGDGAGPLLDAGLAASTPALVIDAAAIPAARGRETALRAHGRAVLTPHHGEMAALLERDADAIDADDEGVAAEVAERFGVTLALKAATTVVRGPDGRCLRYAGGGHGLATGGSGDILAGLVGALLARGADPFVATAWGVWLHGEAGRTLAEAGMPVGFLARELLPLIPRLLALPARREPLGFARP